MLTKLQLQMRRYSRSMHYYVLFINFIFCVLESSANVNKGTQDKQTEEEVIFNDTTFFFSWGGGELLKNLITIKCIQLYIYF